MKLASLICAGSGALVLVATASAAAPAPIGPAVRLEVSVPALVLRGHSATITVKGISVASLEVRAAGASMNLGKRVPWPIRWSRSTLRCTPTHRPIP